jgi:hypothetical protein
MQLHMEIYCLKKLKVKLKIPTASKNTITTGNSKFPIDKKLTKNTKNRYKI